MNPLVSIIIPTYNRAHLISETLESVLTQSYTHWECIMVDDGSIDQTIEIIENYIKLDARFCLLNRPTNKIKGASTCRNIGLENSKGEFIQFLDSDDILHQNKIGNQIKEMLYQKVAISFSTWVHFSHDVSENNKFRFNKINYAKTRTGKELMASFGMDNWFIPVFSWLTHKKLIEKAGVWNIEISNNDDGEYFSRVLYHAEKVVCVNEILAYYRLTPMESLGKLISVDKVNSALRSYQIITKLLKKDGNTDLLSYSKRMYYNMYRWAKKDFPELSKKSAKEFDKINADSFLSSNQKYWLLIKLFGLYKGTLLYDFLINIKQKLKL